jgi:hypothetical protein
MYLSGVSKMADSFMALLDKSRREWIHGEHGEAEDDARQFARGFLRLTGLSGRVASLLGRIQ